nr:MAG TPA: hypothetical protein [Caudoviricetes sp.]
MENIGIFFIKNRESYPAEQDRVRFSSRICR